MRDGDQEGGGATGMERVRERRIRDERD